jgi:hypothetical protein
MCEAKNTAGEGGKQCFGGGRMVISDRVVRKDPPQELAFEQGLKKAREQAVQTEQLVPRPRGGNNLVYSSIKKKVHVTAVK